VHERPGLLRAHALQEQIPLAAAPILVRQARGRFDGRDGLDRRCLVLPDLRGQSTGVRKQRRVGVLVAEAIAAIPRFAGGEAELKFGPTYVAGDTPRELDGRRGEIVARDRVDDAGTQCFGRWNWLAGDAHVERFRDASETREPLRAFSAGNDAEVHFWLANLRRRHRHAVVPCHCQFQAAAERGAVNRHHDRLVAVLDP